jgi:plastocyanin
MSTMRRTRSLLLTFAVFAPVLALAPLAACSGDDTTSAAADSGADAKANDAATHDASTDGGSGGEDSATDGGIDTGREASSGDSGANDATSDAIADAASDGPVRVDGGPITWTVQVGQGGINFSPKTLTIQAGDSVQWTWVASGHSVTSGASCTPDNKFCSPNDTSCATGTTSNAGDTYTHKFTTAGAFPYFCTPHCISGMTGTVTVQ